MPLAAIAGDARRIEVVEVVGAPERLRSRVFDLPRASGAKSTVSGPAQLTTADMAVAVAPVEDVV
jgi:hypothetical protein